jgi:hypothetical protein
MQQLIKSVEENPKTEYSVDPRDPDLGAVKIAIDLPETHRTAWTMVLDPTGALRANLEQVKQTPRTFYMNSFAG